jgi:hypothetical protein
MPSFKNLLLRMFGTDFTPKKTMDASSRMRAYLDNFNEIKGSPSQLETYVLNNESDIDLTLAQLAKDDPVLAIQYTTEMFEAVFQAKSPKQVHKTGRPDFKIFYRMIEDSVSEALSNLPLSERSKCLPKLVKSAIDPSEFLLKNKAAIQECLWLKDADGKDNPHPLDPNILFSGHGYKHPLNVLAFITVIKQNLHQSSLEVLRKAGYEAFVGEIVQKNILQEDFFEEARRKFLLDFARKAFEIAALSKKVEGSNLSVELRSLFVRAQNLISKKAGCDPVFITGQGFICPRIMRVDTSGTEGGQTAYFLENYNRGAKPYYFRATSFEGLKGNLESVVLGEDDLALDLPTVEKIEKLQAELNKAKGGDGTWKGYDPL